MSVNATFENSFEWRLDRWKSNLAELFTITSDGSLDPFKSLPNLVSDLEPNNKLSALRWSILTLWLEAAHCYVLGQFQSCILTSGGVVERILKLEYQSVHENLPDGKWTLGSCAYNLDFSKTRVTDVLLFHAKDCIDPRNDRTHALLEHANPTASIIGGNREVYEVTSNRYMIEPYRGDAKMLIKHSWALLDSLYK
jgi:hypothetical protein